ncbi:hypothetical protein KEJ48_04965, partial [Candidatus Bathyarchaeota archaeon]|nr:hypothetical protein [Candidatus Bathyarchaeota archaeon]
MKRSIEDAFEIARATDQDIIRFHYWRLLLKPTRKIDEYTFLYGNPEREWHIRRFTPSSELFNIVEEYPPKHRLPISIRFNQIEKYLSEMEGWLENYSPR